MGLERHAHEAQQQVHVRVAVQVDGDPAGARDEMDRGGPLEIAREPLDRASGQMQIHIAVAVEVHDLAVDGAQGRPGATTGASRAEVGPGVEALEGALGESHAPIVACSPRRNQGLREK